MIISISVSSIELQCIVREYIINSGWGSIRFNIYMLFTGWEVRTGKIFCRGLKNGPRPKVEGRF